MTLHHDRHHAAYVANLNAAVKDHARSRRHDGAGPARQAARSAGRGPHRRPQQRRRPRQPHDVLVRLWAAPAARPPASCWTRSTATWAASDKLKAEFNRLGLAQFGSGWVFVTVDKAGKLGLLNRPNQETPLMEGGRVLMGNDVWEHAYYLKYQNRRADYLQAWWNVVNWDAVAGRYAQAKAGTLEV